MYDRSFSTFLGKVMRKKTRNSKFSLICTICRNFSLDDYRSTFFGTLLLSWQQLSFARLKAFGFFKIVRCLKSLHSYESFSGAHLSRQHQWMRGQGGGGGILQAIDKGNFTSSCKLAKPRVRVRVRVNPFKDFSSCMIYNFVLKMESSIFQTSF